MQDNYLLEVSDDGPGIDPALAPQIFEPFVRLDQSRNRRTGGTGLGLAIVRSIAGLVAQIAELSATLVLCSCTAAAEQV